MKHLAARMTAIQPFHVMALLARARELEATGRSIVHMEIGEPDFVTPQPVIEAGMQALAQGRTHYTPAVGLPALRERIAAFCTSTRSTCSRTTSWTRCWTWRPAGRTWSSARA